MNLAPHAFSLRQLQYAVAVADTLSFRRAAERCRVSQPSLSAQLAQLESVLGVQLFERDRRRVMPTAAGAVLVERARQLLLQADDLADTAARTQDPLAGTLRLGVIPTISPYLLPSIAPKLRAKFPRLSLYWTEDKTASLTANLAAGDIDGAVVALTADLGDVEKAILAEDPFVLVTAKGHALAKKSSNTSAAELHGQSVLLLDDGHCFREQALEYCSTAETKELAFRATSLSTLVQMVAGGAGVTLLPVLSVPTELRRARLHVRNFKAPAPHRTLALIWRRGSSLGPALTQIAEVIRDAYPQPAE